MDNNYLIYLLENNVNKKTYVGITNNLERRIKQHNNILKGGAKYTTAFKGIGEWVIIGYVDSLTKSEASSYEVLIKNKKMKYIGTNTEKRIHIIELITERKFKYT